MTDLNPPFGTYGLPFWAERVRRLGACAPGGRLGLHTASLLRRLSIGKRPGPFDIEAWPGVRARVHPFDNRCEKRVFCAPHLWDLHELRALRTALADAPADRDFVFLDLGANVGFYSLYLDAAARAQNRRARIVAAEPDPENRRRLEQNAAASEARHVEILPLALGDRPGRAGLTGGERNRGEVRLDPDAASGPVEIVTVMGLAERLGLPHIDAMKLDLEGSDEAVLRAFLDAAPEPLRPSLLIVETPRATDGVSPIAALARGHGYTLARTARTNAIYRLDGGKGAD